MNYPHAELERVAGSVSRETFDTLVTFEKEFLRWNGRINLAAQSTLDAVWARHILDSAQLLPLLKDAKVIADFGSGGGFPGAVLALLLRPDHARTVHLIESNRKKAAFLTMVLAGLSSNVVVHGERVEAVTSKIPAPDIVTARAFASLELILRLAAPWWPSGTGALLHKGRDITREIEEARDGWSFDLIQHPSMTEQGAVILELANVRQIHRAG